MPEYLRETDESDSGGGGGSVDPVDLGNIQFSSGDNSFIDHSQLAGDGGFSYVELMFDLNDTSDIYI